MKRLEEINIPVSYNEKLKTQHDYCDSLKLQACRGIQCTECLFAYVSKKNLDQFNQWIKLNKMKKKTVTLQTENVLKAHEEACGDAKKVLENMIPELFKKEFHPLFKNENCEEEGRELLDKFAGDCMDYSLWNNLGGTDEERIDNIIEAIYKLTK